MKHLLLLPFLIGYLSHAQNCTINDLVITATEDSLCFPNNGITITAANSQVGFNYFLEEVGSGFTIDGPIAGTGSSIDFVTGPIGTNTSYVVVAELVNSALIFDGTDDFVKCGTGLNLTSDFTLEAWVRHSAGSDWQTYVSNIDYIADEGYWLGCNISGEVEFYISTAAWVLGTINVADSNWHHVAAVYNGGTGYLYVDGVLEGSSTMPATLNTTLSFTIGDDSDPINYKLSGTIGDVRVWNIGRSLSEISADMNDCLAGNEVGLMAYYTFEDVGSYTLTDLTSNGNDGTLTNMNPATDWIDGNFSCCSMEMTQQIDVTVFDPTATVTWNGSDTIAANAGLDSYQWIDCNNGNQPIIGETGVSYVPAISGSYAVIGSQGPCTDTSSCIEANVGLGENDLFETIYLYPNPSANGKIHISGEFEITGVEAYDLAERKVAMIYDSQSRTIRLRGRTSGSYFIHVHTETNLFVLKMILAN